MTICVKVSHKALWIYTSYILKFYIYIIVLIIMIICVKVFHKALWIYTLYIHVLWSFCWIPMGPKELINVCKNVHFIWVYIHVHVTSFGCKWASNCSIIAVSTVWICVLSVLYRGCPSPFYQGTHLRWEWPLSQTFPRA